MLSSKGMHFALVLLAVLLPTVLGRQLIARPGESKADCRDELYRPQLHFSAASNQWLNDPNGLVYYAGEYHMHYQNDPYSENSGAKHWGHAVSTDLFNWEDLPVALAPDELGDIWSGSAVVDYKNTTGFQVDPEVSPIVAIFTHAGGPPGQAQSIAYSLNKARDYVMYAGNPVIKNPGIADFRDPKVISHNDRWYMVLAVWNKVQFFVSDDLKEWEYLSDFGAAPPQGSHTGVWECPDFFPLEFEGSTYWVLVVSVSGGGPNTGSTTQYFIGNFDGKNFKSNQLDPLWTDWGMDNYAAVTFFGEENDRRIAIGWMTNAAYAGREPTGNYRGQMTLPQTLSLYRTDEHGIRLKSTIVEEISVLRNPAQLYTYTDFRVLAPDSVWRLSDEIGFENPLMEIDLVFNLGGIVGSSSLAICFVSNQTNEELCVGYDSGRDVNDKIFLNRQDTGLWASSVSSRPTSARLTHDNILPFKIILDTSAIEMFVDDGLTVMTTLFFPQALLTAIEIRHMASGDLTSQIQLLSARVQGLHSIYDC